jgi:NAD-dependent DNA ligase
MYTRGDGLIGATTSYSYIISIPDGNNDDIAVRGGVIINKKVFDIKHVRTYHVPEYGF